MPSFFGGALFSSIVAGYFLVIIVDTSFFVLSQIFPDLVF
jgi:hypothetical protein